MASKCTTDAQRRTRISNLQRMIQTNRAEVRHAEQRIALHEQEIALHQAAMGAQAPDATA